MATNPTDDELWQHILTDGEHVSHHIFHLFGMLPSNPRCKMCKAPFKGAGGAVMRLLGKQQSKNNPRFCDACTKFLGLGGAEITLSMVFADVRGSTAMAEKMSAAEFSQLMKRFYSTASDVLIRTDAMVDRFVGDEVIGFYIPGFAGARHARKAITAARKLLRVTGHADPHGPWLPIGIGVHTGSAFVGAVQGAEGTGIDLTALGDNVNVAARLASQAHAGEILISDAACTASGLALEKLEERQLELKGKSTPTHVHVMTLT